MTLFEKLCINLGSTLKMVSKKSKKADQNINSRLQLVVKSGKYCLGYQGSLKTLRQVRDS